MLKTKKCQNIPYNMNVKIGSENRENMEEKNFKLCNMLKNV